MRPGPATSSPRCYPIVERVLGAGHPDTLADRAELAAWTHEADRSSGYWLCLIWRAALETCLGPGRLVGVLRLGCGIVALPVGGMRPSAQFWVAGQRFTDGRA
jgi:hypothetical protein